MPKATGVQEGWFLSSSDQLKTIQPVFGQEPFQDGRDQYAEGPLTEKRLDGIT